MDENALPKWGSIYKAVWLSKLKVPEIHQQKSSTSAIRLVMLCLVYYVNYKRNDWVVFPSQEVLAEQTGLSIRAVRRALQALIDLGVLKNLPKKNRMSQNKYEIKWDVLESLSATSKLESNELQASVLSDEAPFTNTPGITDTSIGEGFDEI